MLGFFLTFYCKKCFFSISNLHLRIGFVILKILRYAAALRRHCGGTAAALRGTAAVLRQYCGGTAAEPRRHCGSTAVALRRHCGGHCGTSMALRWHCNGTEAALRRHREDTAAALYYCTGCHKNDYKDLHSGLARSTICTHMTTYHSDMMEEKILSFI
jgi:hypothetical protein